MPPAFRKLYIIVHRNEFLIVRAAIIVLLLAHAALLFR